MNKEIDRHPNTGSDPIRLMAGPAN